MTEQQLLNNFRLAASNLINHAAKYESSFSRIKSAFDYANRELEELEETNLCRSFLIQS